MKGIIYKITCNETGESYYGSTICSLNRRMTLHKSGCKDWKEGKSHYVTSFSIIERGNYLYSIIETVECEDKKQLAVLERKYIEENDCVNKQIPGRSNKEWHEDHREQKKEYDIQYNETNKEKKREQNKEWKKANREKINENQRLRRANLKEIHNGTI